MVALESIEPNEWNPNEMTEAEFSMLVDNITRLGFADPLLVVEDGNRYRIIDGEHRYRAALLLGMEQVPAVVVDLAEKDQRMQTVRLNNIKGEWDPIKFNKLVSDMLEKHELSIEDAAYELGFADPSEFHLLRELMRDSLPDEKTKKEFDNKAKSANTASDLYNILTDLMGTMQNPDGSLWIRKPKGSKSIWVVSNQQLVSAIVDLNNWCKKNKVTLEEKLVSILRKELAYVTD
jgi:ParB/RepB/Spo0J family partition protein